MLVFVEVNPSSLSKKNFKKTKYMPMPFGKGHESRNFDKKWENMNPSKKKKASIIWPILKQLFLRGIQ
jgi:hypothetical protein